MTTPLLSEYVVDSTSPVIDRKKQAAVFDTLIQTSLIAEHLTSEEKRVAFVKSLDPDAFLDLLKGINGTLLNQQPSEVSLATNLVGLFDEERVVTVDVTPAPEDKIELLNRVLEYAQAEPTSETQALILGFGVNAVHPFMDGNGRLSRALYVLLSGMYKPNDPDLPLILGEFGNEALPISPNVFMDTFYATYSSDLGSSTWVQGGSTISKVAPVVSDLKFMEAEFVDTPRREFDTDAFLEAKIMFADEKVGPILTYLLTETTTYRSVRDASRILPRGKVFMFDMFLQNANDDEMAKMYSIFRTIKKDYINLYLEFLAGRGPSDVKMIDRDAPSMTFTPRAMGIRGVRAARMDLPNSGFDSFNEA